MFCGKLSFYLTINKAIALEQIENNHSFDLFYVKLTMNLVFAVRWPVIMCFELKIQLWNESVRTEGNVLFGSYLSMTAQVISCLTPAPLFICVLFPSTSSIIVTGRTKKRPELASDNNLWCPCGPAPSEIFLTSINLQVHLEYSSVSECNSAAAPFNVNISWIKEHDCSKHFFIFTK